MNLLKRTTAFVVVSLLLGAAGCGNSGDEAITTRVKHAISKEPALKGTQVSVSTDQKVVHLGGTVKSRDERALLIAVARKVDGVKAVKTDLVVKTQPKTAAKTSAKRPTKTQPRANRQHYQEFAGTGR